MACTPTTTPDDDRRSTLTVIAHDWATNHRPTASAGELDEIANIVVESCMSMSTSFGYALGIVQNASPSSMAVFEAVCPQELAAAHEIVDNADLLD